MKKYLLSLAMILASAGAWAQDAAGGPEVTFTNVQKNGTKYYLYINDGNELAISSDEAILNTDAAKFRVTIQDNGKYTFYNETKQLYMIWRGKGNGYNSDKGVLGEYNATYCDWNLRDASSTSSGTYFMYSKRDGGNNDGSPVIMSAKGTFDAWGNTVAWHDNYSNLYTINGLPNITFNYSYSYNNTVVAKEQVKAVVGFAYPNPNLPVGITAESKSGLVQASDAGQTFTFTCTDGDCPVKFAKDAASITNWYYLRVHSNQTKYIQNLGSEGIEWADAQFGADEIDSHLWGFVGNPFKTQVISKSAATSGIVSTGDGETTVGATPTEFFMAFGKTTATDKFCLQHSEGNYLNGQSGKLKHWWNNDAGSDFIPVEYTEADIEISSTNNYATMYLGYQTYIPEGVKAYIVSGTTETKATLQEITGIIPGNTGVLLENAGKFKFKKAIGTPATVEGNKLLGTVAKQDVTPASGATCYVLHKPADGAVGFYKTKLTDGKFQNNANKAYLSVPAAAAGARVFLFDFGTETAIESIEGAENADAVVYDLAGRRVKGAQKGLYIVNGKVVIK